MVVRFIPSNGLDKGGLVLGLMVFLMVFGGLLFIEGKVPFSVILVERFFPGYGWIECFLVGIYGGVVAYNMRDVKKNIVWRRYTWLLFSVVFFSQLGLGLMGVERCLMTGKLHLPVPMVILGGPLYRGQPSFMTYLFLSTMLIVGPGWCSHLCYFGGFDGYFASYKERSESLSWKVVYMCKLGILGIVIIVALGFRLGGVDYFIAGIAGLMFGLIGVGVMILASRVRGVMVHCVTFCPLGTVVNILGLLNPFRMRIDSGCSKCMRCVSVCRYNALGKEAFERGRPYFTCSLCGDCVSSCLKNFLSYSLFGMRYNMARDVYLFLSVSLHAIFLALARV